MDSIRQDVVYALRRLTAAPGFAAVAILTLALGIGANGALFSLVNGVLLRPLPYPEADRLVRVVGRYEGRSTVLSPANFLDIEAATTSLEGLAAVDNGAFTLTGRGEARRVESAEVSAGFFAVMGVRPALGRGFEPGENEPGKAKVVVIAHALCQELFGADPGALGQTLVLDGQGYLVVGVAPPGFAYPSTLGKTDVWVPLVYDERFREARGAWYLGSVGRLRRGSSLEAARAELETIGGRLAAEHADQNEGLGVGAIPLFEHIVGDSRRGLLVLLGAVGFVLLIGCVNVANLLLARYAGRGTELAVRAALGAGRARIVRQLATEALALGAAGGALGVLVAYWGRAALLALQPGDLPRVDETGIDAAVLAFCAGLSILTALLFGALPALFATRRDPVGALREGGRGLLSSRGRLGPGLVVAEVALAVTLLVGAGLLLRSFQQLRSVDPGIAAGEALTFRTALPETAYDEPGRVRFYRALEERLSALPGVVAVGSTVGLPMTDLYFNLSFEVEGRPPLPPAQQPSLEVRVVTPGYFRAMGIPLLAGRSFTDADAAGAPQVVLLSRGAARRHFPGEDPIGKRIVLGWGQGPGKPKAGGVVAGIVGDVREHGLAQAQPLAIYLPHAQRPLLNMSLVVRGGGDPLALVPSARAAVRELDASVPVVRVQSLGEVLAGSVAGPRFYAALLAAFATTALALAALGVFGVLSYGVSQRSREIGVRLALGAKPGDVLRMVLREALVLSGLGLVVGAAGALALGRSLGSLLFGLAPTDPWAFASAVGLLAAAAFAASALPALRAARLDPLNALRSE